MGKSNRAMRRKKAKFAVKNQAGMVRAQEERVGQLLAGRTNTTTRLLLGAFLMSDMLCYGKKQKLSTRLETSIRCIHYYVDKIVRDDLTREEHELFKQVLNTVANTDLYGGNIND